MLTTREGELPTIIKIEPNVPLFIDYFNKMKRPETERHNEIKKFLEDKDGKWANKIFEFLKEKSVEMFNEDLSLMFEKSKISTNTKTISTNGNSSGGNNFDEIYNQSLIKLGVNNHFLDQEQFIKLISVLLKLHFELDTMCKISFSFNNINTCICIFNPDVKKIGEETLIINARSRRYLDSRVRQKCEDLILYLNKLVKPHL